MFIPILAQPAAASTTAHKRPQHRAIDRIAAIHHAAAEHHAVYHTAGWHHTRAWHHVVYRHAAAWHHIAPTRHFVRHVTWHGPHGHVWHHVAHGISCVPYARIDSGIELRGNAWQWWSHAAGVYARGQVPERGAVLAFRSNPRMPLGHVAVVSRIVNPREVLINQANWSPSGTRGAITTGVPVVDVSEANDWSAVRVGVGRSGDFGAVYPTYGFIYDRPDTGIELAQARAPAPQPMLNPVPRDLRPVAERPWHTYEEVAEAPAVPRAAGPGSRVFLPGNVGAIDRK